MSTTTPGQVVQHDSNAYLDVDRLCRTLAKLLQTLLLPVGLFQQSRRVLVLVATPSKHISSQSRRHNNAMQPLRSTHLLLKEMNLALQLAQRALHPHGFVVIVR